MGGTRAVAPSSDSADANPAASDFGTDPFAVGHTTAGHATAASAPGVPDHPAAAIAHGDIPAAAPLADGRRCAQCNSDTFAITRSFPYAGPTHADGGAAAAISHGNGYPSPGDGAACRIGRPFQRYLPAPDCGRGIDRRWPDSAPGLREAPCGLNGQLGWGCSWSL